MFQKNNVWGVELLIAIAIIALVFYNIPYPLFVVLFAGATLLAASVVITVCIVYGFAELIRFLINIDPGDKD